MAEHSPFFKGKMVPQNPQSIGDGKVIYQGEIFQQAMFDYPRVWIILGTM
jgi:hypothetical protein